jgi:hypothetical protein
MASPNTPDQLQTQGQVAADKPSVVIQFDDAGELDHLTAPSLTYLTRRLGEFGLQVLREARSIEHTEHVGSGPPEITAAHIEEAWWVSRRRIRRSKHPIIGAVARVSQGFGLAGFGIGLANLKTEWWGTWVFAGCTVVTFIAYLLEVHLQRTE